MCAWPLLGSALASACFTMADSPFNREKLCQYTVVEASNLTQRSFGDDPASQWLFFEEACQPGWGGGAEEAVPRQGLLGPWAGVPSAALQRRCPGLRQAWKPERRQQLLRALSSMEKPSTTTTIGKLRCADHPAARGQSDAHGLFAGPAGIGRDELVGWYGGELVLANEVLLDGSYAASFTAVDQAEMPQGDAAQAEYRPDVRIDATRLRTRMAFINDFHWDVLGHRYDVAPPGWWPAKPNVELRQVVLRLEQSDRRALCRCSSKPTAADGNVGAWWPLIGVYALEDIAPYTELFLDYGDGYWGRIRELSEVQTALAYRSLSCSTQLNSCCPCFCSCSN